jgi:NADH:ubiquinone oxidoreductase subunit 6 (subunit J)
MSWPDIWVNVLFYLFAAGAVGGALAVARSRNIVRSAFALLAVLVSAAGLYALMKADFIAAAQVLIYVGGILVLIIFAVMLTHRITDVNVSNDSAPGLAAACACFCLLFSIVLIVVALARWLDDPFKRQAEEVVSRSPSTELVQRQWQPDGRTGLARGGATHEEAVVLEVVVRKGIVDGSSVVFRWAEGAVVKETKAVPVRSEKVRKGDVEEIRWFARFEPKGLSAKKPGVKWNAKLVGTSGEDLSPWTSSLAFEVNEGVTRLAARGLSGRYLFAFEVVSVLLLAALVGAAFLARKEVKEA